MTHFPHNLLPLAQSYGNSGDTSTVIFWGVVIVVAIVVLVVIALLSRYINLYVQALTSGARMRIIDLVGISLRKLSPQTIVNARIQAHRAGLNVNQNQMESHVLAGGNLMRVINAMIAAEKARIDLPWQDATAIDLAGRDIFEAIQTSVNPKVIDVPSREMGRATIDAVAKDGIQLKVRARVTVRTNIKRLVGGATEETIIARVGEGIVTSIGSADSHKLVLENPDTISRSVLAKGLDANTAFEIVSIDIADVDVGENIDAKLQTDQADADKKVAQAQAEKRRALAVAQEQENIAEVAKNRALVVLAEAEIPKAMAEAFRNGNFGIMDYYRMKNVQADTDMRKSIADSDSNPNN